MRKRQPAKSSTNKNARKGLNRRLFWLYNGDGRVPYIFRWSMLSFDILTIAYFMWAPFESQGRSHTAVDFTIGIVVAFDLFARFYIDKHKQRFALNWLNWADLAVVITMLLPLLVSNFAFLRVLRAVRAVRAFTFMSRVKGITPFLQRHDIIVNKVTNLIVFVFIMAAIVYSTQIGINDNLHTYVDALYFTLTTLTTTGYGDILMEGQTGRLLSILIMALGLTLFLQLLRSIVEPDQKVEIECTDCGLKRHDRDAIHCKHCGRVMHIKTDGFE